jgi:hypothetical protein
MNPSTNPSHTLMPRILSPGSHQTSY